MVFLQRLKTRGVHNQDTSLLPEAEVTAVDGIAQLYVDVYQTERMIVIYAQSAGADMNDMHVSIEGDDDIVLIEGKRIRPEYIAFAHTKLTGSYVAQECVWGDFYRRIILPESVNIQEADAKIKNGVLILLLPLHKPNEKEKVTSQVKGGHKDPVKKRK